MPSWSFCYAFRRATGVTPRESAPRAAGVVGLEKRAELGLGAPWTRLHASGTAEHQNR
jgi:hypothetical protein